MKIARVFPSIIFIITLVFTMFTSADCLSESEALAIGVEKYLEFLWMVDGAFNNSKDNNEFIVNDKKLDNDNKKFTCTYKNNSCIGNNFENEFKRIFASNISYNKVYGDGILYTWIKHENGEYRFSNLKNCDTYRMDTNRIMKVTEITSNRLVFKVSGKYDKRDKFREFALIKENDDWKVTAAYYHDLCDIDYNIE